MKRDCINYSLHWWISYALNGIIIHRLLMPSATQCYLIYSRIVPRERQHTRRENFHPWELCLLPGWAEAPLSLSGFVLSAEYIDPDKWWMWIILVYSAGDILVGKRHWHMTPGLHCFLTAAHRRSIDPARRFLFQFPGPFLCVAAAPITSPAAPSAVMHFSRHSPSIFLATAKGHFFVWNSGWPQIHCHNL